jgi:hypothetical protein
MTFVSCPLPASVPGVPPQAGAAAPAAAFIATGHAGPASRWRLWKTPDTEISGSRAAFSPQGMINFGGLRSDSSRNFKPAGGQCDSAPRVFPCPRTVYRIRSEDSD